MKHLHLLLLPLGGLILNACGTDSPAEPSLRFEIRASDGKPWGGIPLHLQVSGRDTSIVTDASGRATVRQSLFDKLLEVDGCPWRPDTTMGSNNQAVWKITLSDSLRALGHESLAIPVRGAAGARLRWSIATDWYSSRWSSASSQPWEWHPLRRDSLQLDAQGRGVLRFSALLHPLREDARLLFVQGTDTLSWWIDPQDSVLHLPGEAATLSRRAARQPG